MHVPALEHARKGAQLQLDLFAQLICQAAVHDALPTYASVVNRLSRHEERRETLLDERDVGHRSNG